MGRCGAAARSGDSPARGRAGGELAEELEADDLRDEHGDGLAEHRGLGLDAADAFERNVEIEYQRNRERYQFPVSYTHLTLPTN